MIQHLHKKLVVSNTSNTEQVEIMYPSSGREERTSTDFTLCYEKRLLSQISVLKKANQNLIRDRIVLDRHNQALHNCWQEALLEGRKVNQDLLAASSEITRLKTEVNMEKGKNVEKTY